MLAHDAPELMSYDLAPPLRHDREEVRRGLLAWFPTWDGPIGLELGDLDVVVGGDVAFAHGLERMRGRKTSGETVDMWFRSTFCLRKVGGEWFLAHEHASVPFYMDGSLRAAVDLAP